MLEGNHRSIMAEGHGTGTCPAPSTRFPSPVNSGGGNRPSDSSLQTNFCKKDVPNSVPYPNRDKNNFSRKCSSAIPSSPSVNVGIALNINSKSINYIRSKDFKNRMITDQDELGHATKESANLCQISRNSCSSSSATHMEGNEYYIDYYQCITFTVDTDVCPSPLQTLEPPPIKLQSSSKKMNSECGIHLLDETLGDLVFEMKSISSNSLISFTNNFINIPPPQALSCSTVEDFYLPIFSAYGY